MNFVYVVLWLGFILYSIHMNNKNKQFITYIYGTSTVMGIFSLVVTIVLAVDIVRGLIGDTSCNFLINYFSYNLKSELHIVDSWRTNNDRFIKICNYINNWVICCSYIYLWIMFFKIFICL
jgi:hypothetical protein